jgi:tRNA modification GTPase
MREGLQKVPSYDETIVAISTPAGRSGIGVVRLSGRAALLIGRKHLRPAPVFEHRKASVGRWHGAAGDCIDEVVVTPFFSPHSYTGDDVVEISAHGNPVILGRIVESIQSAGARIARPGEFTLRAVANGKMDLIQAEAVRDFIQAQTGRQADAALRQMEGGLSKHLRSARDRAVDIIARLEAGIDFAEDDVEVPDNRIVAVEIESVIGSLQQLQRTFEYGRLLADGIRVAIVGKPNVGKSSLFNRLVAADRAIVTDIPGTTRDVLLETISVDGIPLRFADTAGIHDTDDTVESLGVRRTIEAIAESNVVLAVFDGSSPLDTEDFQVLSRVKTLPHVIVINKSDLSNGLPASFNGSGVVSVSAKTGAGIHSLLEAVREFLLERQSEVTDHFVLTSARQNDVVLKTLAALNTARGALLDGVPHEMVLLNLYDALSMLGELTGEVVTEDILDRIFSTFCIGK